MPTWNRAGPPKRRRGASIGARSGTLSSVAMTFVVGALTMVNAANQVIAPDGHP
jgi:hypothetical protein